MISPLCVEGHPCHLYIIGPQRLYPAVFVGRVFSQLFEGILVQVLSSQLHDYKSFLSQPLEDLKIDTKHQLGPSQMQICLSLCLTLILFNVISYCYLLLSNLTYQAKKMS